MRLHDKTKPLNPGEGKTMQVSHDPPTIDEFLATVRAMDPKEIEAKVEAHLAEIRMLRRLLLTINKTEPAEIIDS